MERKKYSVIEKVRYHQQRKKEGNVYSRFWLYGVTDSYYDVGLQISNADIARMRKERIKDKDKWRRVYGVRNGQRCADKYRKELWQKYNNRRDVEREIYEVKTGKKRW